MDFLKRLTVVILILMMAGSALAQRDWAPGLEKKKGPGKQWGNSAIWIRLTPSVGSWNPWDALSNTFDDYSDDWVFHDYYGGGGITMVGTSLEVAFRPIKSSSEAKPQWAIEFPFVASVHQWEFEFKWITISTQLIPTVHFTFARESGFEFSPYFGYGGGLVLHGEQPYNSLLDAVFSLRLGTDLMFTRMLGVRLQYTRSSVKLTGDEDVYERTEDGNYEWRLVDIDGSATFYHFGLGVVFHP